MIYYFSTWSKECTFDAMKYSSGVAYMSQVVLRCTTMYPTNQQHSLKVFDPSHLLLLWLYCCLLKEVSWVLLWLSDALRQTRSHTFFFTVPCHYPVLSWAVLDFLRASIRLEIGPYSLAYAWREFRKLGTSIWYDLSNKIPRLVGDWYEDI